jgi:phage-related protein
VNPDPVRCRHRHVLEGDSARARGCDQFRRRHENKETTAKLTKYLNARYLLSQQQIQTYQVENLLQPLLERHAQQIDSLFSKSDEQNRLVPIDLLSRLLQESEKQSKLLFSLTGTISSAFDTKLTSLRRDIAQNAERINALFSRNDEQNKPIDLFISLLHESEKQSMSLANFSTDLAEAIGNTLDAKLTSAFFELQKSIDMLRSNNQANAQNLVSDVVGNLQDAIAGLQGSLTNVFQEQVRQIGQMVGTAVNALDSVPERFEAASSKLLETIGKVPASVGEGFTEHSQNLERLFSDGAGKMDASMQAMIQSVEEAVKKQKEMSVDLESSTLKLVSDVTHSFQSSIPNLQNALSSVFQEQVQQIGQTVGTAASALDSVPEKIDAALSNLLETLSQFPSSIGGEFTQQTRNISRVFSEGAERLESSTRGMIENLESAAQNQKSMSDTLELRLRQFEEEIESSRGFQADFVENMEKIKMFIEKSSPVFSEIEDMLNAIKESEQGMSNVLEAVEKENAALSEQRARLNETTQRSIADMSSAITDLRKLNEEYAQKFPAIRDGLEGVFKELSSGLTAFQSTVHEKMNDSIAEFSRNFSEAASSLASAVDNFGEFLEDFESKAKANSAKANSSGGAVPSVRTPSRGQ